ncbi:toprim domain-containing protein [Azospirillum sp. TSH100]|uniref:toprim domain-containing protein n=2 Tax=Azospirillum sp. TSH100 TaxID=652764 RepID=UPI001FFFB863|nr:toprim domain-containing protein [Azospirillum sp. TSH100]
MYPDAFGRINERFPSTTEAPNATADAYMSHVRHLDIRGIRSWYRQGHFRHKYGNRTTATVVFDVAEGIWMERLIEPVTIQEPGDEPEKRKAHFVGKHGGLWWQPPDLQLVDGEELWLVEGCIDAIALALNGIKAVATLSAGNYPAKMLAALAERGIRPTLVWALDNDRTGRKYTQAHVKAAREAGFCCKAALIPQHGQAKRDWNDVHNAGELEEQDLLTYRYHGDLLLAPSAHEAGLLTWQHSKKKLGSFSLEFGTRTWWWHLPEDTFMRLRKELMEAEDPLTSEEADYEAARRCGQVNDIANCTFQFLYFQKLELTNESWYYARIRFPHGVYEIKDTFTGAQVASGSEFKKRLLGIAPGALFTGATWQLNWIIKHHLDAIRIVQTVDFIGYSKEHRAWIFNDLAVTGAKVYPINDEDFFEIGKLSVKSLNQSLKLHIGTQRSYRSDWIELVWEAFGPRGIVAAAFWLGSLFAEQIRELHKSYPFLEVVGEAGAGKSTLIEFLWKLVGRNDYEGFDPNKSTLAARARIMSQVANLPVCLIESDRGDDAKQKQFDWDELKTAYNGRASRARGVANGGNDTNEPAFRGSVVVSQNAPVNASEAIMQRLIHLKFRTGGHTRQSKVAADTLASMPVEEVSYFALQATLAEDKVMRTVAEKTPDYEAELGKHPEIRSNRIAKNHGQLMALVDALADLTGMEHDWRDKTLALLVESAVERQQAIASDHPIVDEFWDAVEFMGLAALDHARSKDGIIALNLNQVMAQAQKAGQAMPTLLELKRHLKDARSRPFIEIKTVRSELPGFETVKCWIFKAPKEDRL